MKVLWRRILGVAVSLTAAAGGLLVAGAADAQTVSTGTLSFSGDSGDYISQGKAYSYSISKGDGLTVSSSNGSLVSVSVNAYNGDWWTLDIDAPGTAVLAPGTYTEAHRYPFNGTGPGLDLSGNGRGCNTLTGSFTVTKAVFGAQGYVQNFDATFEEHCEGGTPAVRGEVHISNPPAPPAPTPKRTATTSPRAATASPHATPSSTPSAAASSTPSAAASSGNTAANATGASTSAKPAAVRSAFHPSLLLAVVALVAWILLNGVSLAAVGIVMAARRR
jgi:hypothetical protein